MEQAIFKLNGGKFALLCNKCRVIIKEGKDFNGKEKKAIEGDIILCAQYCKECKSKIKV
jgi:hypothetical protein